jgi:hypothetical protein
MRAQIDERLSPLLTHAGRNTCQRKDTLRPLLQERHGSIRHRNGCLSRHGVRILRDAIAHTPVTLTFGGRRERDPTDRRNCPPRALAGDDDVQAARAAGGAEGCR